MKFILGLSLMAVFGLTRSQVYFSNPGHFQQRDVRFSQSRGPFIGGLADFGVGGVARHGGLLGGVVGSRPGVQRVQRVQVRAPVRRVSSPSLGLGQYQVGHQSLPTIPRLGSLASLMFDTPDTPDMPDTVFASRGMGLYQAEALRRMSDADRVILI